MSKLVKFELNYKGVGELLHSKEMEDVLMSYADKIASNAGAHYEAKQYKTRVIVVPADEKGVNDNYENNTLLKAVHK